ncbi:hypothetical protein E2542_SST23426 [Spatholobus suberectus]|nr:hypothetical protein E2542_SST23426 [Spatholobus suberectus]
MIKSEWAKIHEGQVALDPRDAERRCNLYSAVHEDGFVLNLVFISSNCIGVYELMYLSSEKCSMGGLYLWKLEDINGELQMSGEAKS